MNASTSNIITASYNEVISVDFTSDAWFNATAAAKQFNKRPIDWLNLESTKEYVRVLHNAVFPEIHVSGILTLEQNQLVRTKKGSPENGGGSWFHPELAVEFARWLSVGFSIWCNTTIRKILRGETIGEFKPTIDPINDDLSTTLISDFQQQHLAVGVGAKAERLNRNTQWMWCAFKKHLGINSYKALTLAKYPAACAYLSIKPLTDAELKPTVETSSLKIPEGYELIKTSYKLALEKPINELRFKMQREAQMAILRICDVVDELSTIVA